MDGLGRAGVAVLASLASVAAFASPIAARAAAFVADFSSVAGWDATATTPVTSRALWDTVNGRISAAVSANGVEINFGTGEDGEFNDGPAQTGITVSGSTITIDTDAKSEGTFNFTSFNLSTGKTIRATGTNPLRIRVLGSTTIAGTIDVSGTNGTQNSLEGPTPGGSAGAGGFAGGAGGRPAASSSGLPSSGSNSRGGTAGDNGAFTNVGGGGGCNGSGSATNSTGAGGSGGQAGACGTAPADVANGFESSFIGGGGGGGGGAETNAGDEVSGGGGGGGGGALQIAALGPISFGTSPQLGSILAKGGNGGLNTADRAGVGNSCGAGGGGGGGGSVWLQANGAIASASDQGSVNAGAGAAGTDDAGSGRQCAALAGAGDGGAGSTGVFRIDAPSSDLTGTAVSVPRNTPAVRSGQTYSVTSKALDTGFEQSVFSAPTETVDSTSSGCGTTGSVTVTYSSSSDGVTFGTPVGKADIAQLNGSRYIRYTVTITTTGATPPCLTGLTIPYGTTAYQLKGGLIFCGTVGGAAIGGDGKPFRGATGSRRNDSSSSPLDAAGDFAIISLAAALAKLLSIRSRRQARCFGY